jgi:FAD/FMN-containing dehydrogenase
LRSETPPQLVSSWGNVIRAPHEVLHTLSRQAPFPELDAATNILPRGNGRSYGDSCLNVGAALLDTKYLDRFIAFDPDTGVLVCESGTLLADILKLAVPKGWFVPVTPGTRFVTVGGAIANDVHGKNHHGAGTFSRHVRRFELLRSDGQRLVCSPEVNAAWFAATAGGLGLTGLITWAELQLRRIPGPWMEVESIRYSNLDEFMQLCAESDRDFEYTVAWVDCLKSGRQLGRGLFQRANHSPEKGKGSGQSRSKSVPLTPPFSLINEASVRVFNPLHYHRQFGRRHRSLEHYETFFYPLDGVLHMNRLYGPRGMYQYQCVVPGASGREVTAALLEKIARSGFASFLAVLKQFGAIPSPALLSFPREGLTLAIDFANRGARLEHMFRQLDAIVEEAGGRLYPAKDGRMPGKLFRAGYPRWREFTRFIDPRCSSSFWRRVTEDA